MSRMSGASGPRLRDQAPRKDILCIGSLNWDFTQIVDDLTKQDGQTITAMDSKQGPGGKGANQALAAHRLSHYPGKGKRRSSGASAVDICVSMIGAVGKDYYSTLVTRNLSKDGVDITGVDVVADKETGMAHIEVKKSSGLSTVTYTPGANETLRTRDFSTVKTLEVNGGKPDLLLLQLETPRETVEQIINTASKANIQVLLNAAPAKMLTMKTWRCITHLILNKFEAAILFGSTTQEIEAVGMEAGWRKVVDKFLANGAKHVVITLGADGAIFGNKQGNAQRENAAPASQVVDTTSAGDTFIGAYAVQILFQMDSGALDMKKAVVYALKAAALVVATPGTQDTIPWAADLE